MREACDRRGIRSLERVLWAALLAVRAGQGHGARPRFGAFVVIVLVLGWYLIAVAFVAAAFAAVLVLLRLRR